MTAQELADELEVSPRTIYRDVESLSGAGIPVYADRGPAGGYRLLEGYRTRLTGLTMGEAASLFLSGAPAADLGLGAELAAAELKLLAALPKELAVRATQVRERFHLDVPGWFHPGDPVPHLEELADAVWNQQRIRVRYRRWGADPIVKRDLDPLGLVLKAGNWYLIARADGTDRTYRVSRVLDLDRLPETFTRPDDFDLAAFWRAYLDRFNDNLYSGEAVVRLSPDALRASQHLVNPAVGSALRERADEPGEDGWVRTVMPYESLRHALVDVMKLGAGAEVIEPPELRERVAETVREMAARYASNGVPSRSSTVTGASEPTQPR